MNATQILVEEHHLIEEMLNVLEKMVERIAQGEKVAVEHLESVLSFIRGFADGCHHQKEEEFLFPAMEEAGIPGEGGPIGVMLLEHNMGRELVKKMSEGVKKYQQGESEGQKQIVENARGYIDLLRQHIYKENNVLFPMANAHLTSNQQEKLMENWKDVEKRMGEGKHRDYKETVERLKAVYGA
ncbi:MAG: hemerythrin domain-containing protein [bacterium JZ-2024 1]